MQQRGSDRLNVHRDDVMKHEMQGRLRAEHPTRAEEWHDPEPDADDDPELVSGPVPRTSAVGPEEAEDEELRFELARHLGRTAFPGDREDLLGRLAADYAPDRLIDMLRELPEAETYANVQDVVTALGRRPRA